MVFSGYRYTEGSMSENNVRKGRMYEQAAGCYLEQEGLEILQYNYRCPFGEIDIIAREKETLVFCEVKYRFDKRRGSPLEAVGVHKQRKIFYTAMHYMAEKGKAEVPCRFDVIGIQGRKICHIRGAFEGK